MKLPQGVILNFLKVNKDERGTFTEIFRESWIEDSRYIQWNVVASKAGVLRGVHVHKKHYDYLTVIKGKALIGLHDLRKHSLTFQLSAFIELNEDNSNTIIIPPGVAHGFYFIEPSIHIYAVSEYWDLEDELGCHFREKELALEWPDKNPLLSDHDKNLPSYSKLFQILYPE